MSEPIESGVNATAAPVPPPFEALAKLFANRREWEDRFATTIMGNPLESLAGLMLGGSVLFYTAEVGVNPKIRNFWDALYYITTCASVGYADIFAKTDYGKVISSVVCTFGPSLCARVFDRPALSAPPAAGAVLEKLDAILNELRRSREAPR